MKRVQLTEEMLDDALADLKRHAMEVIKAKGWGSFASRHEGYGVIDIEKGELRRAIEQRLPDNTVIHELKDVAFSCLFLQMGMEHGGTDW